MNLVVVGISHKKAPLELRERFALNERIIPEVLRRLQSEPEIEEAVIISTCNRVEFVLVAFEKQDGMAGFRRFAESFYGVRFDEYAHCFYVHREEEAVRHTSGDDDGARSVGDERGGCREPEGGRSRP